MKKVNAWVTLLSTNNEYLYLILKLKEDLKKVNTKYPLYVGVTSNINEQTKAVLSAAEIKVFNLDENEIKNSSFYKESIRLGMCQKYLQATLKLSILKEKRFNKIVYIDSDMQINENIDDLFECEHMSAVEDASPAKTHSSYKVGDSIFCAGLFVWDFNEAKELNQTTEIFELLSKLPKGIQWNDQNILNYYFKNWIDKPSKHLNWTYGLMCEDPKLRAARGGNLKKNSIKVMHFVSDAKNKMPFKTIKQESDLMYPYIKTYFESVNEAVRKINNLNLENVPKLPLLQVENIRLKSKKENKKEDKKTIVPKADAFTGLTEEWWKEDF